MCEIISLMIAMEALKVSFSEVFEVPLRDEVVDEKVILDFDDWEDEVVGDLEYIDSDAVPVKMELAQEKMEPVRKGEFGCPTNPIPLYPRIEPPLEIK